MFYFKSFQTRFYILSFEYVNTCLIRAWKFGCVSILSTKCGSFVLCSFFFSLSLPQSDFFFYLFSQSWQRATVKQPINYAKHFHSYTVARHKLIKLFFPWADVVVVDFECAEVIAFSLDFFFFSFVQQTQYFHSLYSSWCILFP